MKRSLILFVAIVLVWAASGQAATLIHRWSFTGNANDSVGTANATLVNANAAIVSNQLDLTANTGTSADLNTQGYATIPDGGTVGGLSSATIEGWTTWGGPIKTNYMTVLSFGSGDATNYLAVLSSDGSVAGIDSGSATVDVTAPKLGIEFPVGTEVHFAAIYDSVANQLTLYTSIAAPVTVTPSNAFTLAGLATSPVNYLGRDFFTTTFSDPIYKGKINEVRIWDGVLTANEFNTHTQLGPDVVPEPVSLCLLGLGGLALLRRRS